MPAIAIARSVTHYNAINCGRHTSPRTCRQPTRPHAPFLAGVYARRHTGDRMNNKGAHAHTHSQVEATANRCEGATEWVSSCQMGKTMRLHTNTHIFCVRQHNAAAAACGEAEEAARLFYMNANRIVNAEPATCGNVCVCYMCVRVCACSPFVRRHASSWHTRARACECA